MSGRGGSASSFVKKSEKLSQMSCARPSPNSVGVIVWGEWKPCTSSMNVPSTLAPTLLLFSGALNSGHGPLSVKAFD